MFLCCYRSSGHRCDRKKHARCCQGEGSPLVCRKRVRYLGPCWVSLCPSLHSPISPEATTADLPFAFSSESRSFIPKSKIADPTKVGLILKVNGTIKQKGEAKDMIFDIPRIVEHVSSIFTLSVSFLIETPCAA